MVEGVGVRLFFCAYTTGRLVLSFLLPVTKRNGA